MSAAVLGMVNQSQFKSKPKQPKPRSAKAKTTKAVIASAPDWRAELKPKAEMARLAEQERQRCIANRAIEIARHFANEDVKAAELTQDFLLLGYVGPNSAKESIDRHQRYIKTLGKLMADRRYGQRIQKAVLKLLETDPSRSLVVLGQAANKLKADEYLAHLEAVLNDPKLNTLVKSRAGFRPPESTTKSKRKA